MDITKSDRQAKAHFKKRGRQISVAAMAKPWLVAAVLICIVYMLPANGSGATLAKASARLASMLTYDPRVSLRQPRMQRTSQNGNPDFAVWVIFTDKPGSQLLAPISPKALTRRAKHMLRAGILLIIE